MKFNLLSLVLVAAVAFAGCGSGSTSSTGEAKGSEPKTEQEKTLYALGLIMGGNLTSFSLTPAELDFVKKGIADAATGAKPLVDLQDYGQKVQELAQSRAMAAAEVEKKKSAAFLENAAKEQGAQKTASGLIYQDRQARDRRQSHRHRHGEGPLPGLAHRRHRLRQLPPAGPAGRVPAQPGDPLLDARGSRR